MSLYSVNFAGNMEIPLEATELTTGELKLISGGWEKCPNKHKKENVCKKKNKQQEHKNKCHNDKNS